MVHIESSEHWGQKVPGSGDDGPFLDVQIGKLATVVGQPGRGAKVSLQVDQTFVDRNDPEHPYPGGPTSLSFVLSNGGNFWCQCHCTTFEHLTTVWACMVSAFETEKGPSSEAGWKHVAGRSGGADFDDPNLDWVSITQASTMKLMNSSVINYYSLTPQSLRPYFLNNQEIQDFYWHEAAPGALNPRMFVETPRMRPFYAKNSSAWTDNGDLRCIYPHNDFASTGSILMIPQPVRWDFGDAAVQRTGARGAGITQESLEAMMTAVWTSSEMATRFQASITNVWYTPVRPEYLEDVSIDLIGNFVTSINQLLDVNGSNPRASWNNMNEIASLFTHPLSRYNF